MLHFSQDFFQERKKRETFLLWATSSMYSSYQITRGKSELVSQFPKLYNIGNENKHTEWSGPLYKGSVCRTRSELTRSSAECAQKT